MSGPTIGDLALMSQEDRTGARLPQFPMTAYQYPPIRPIRVYQCKQDCCVVRVPSRRFWYVRTPKGRETFSCFRDASFYAGWEALRLPQEVTA